MIKVQCSGCSSGLDVPLEYAGTTIECSRCHTYLTVPALAKPISAPLMTAVPIATVYKPVLAPAPRIDLLAELDSAVVEIEPGPEDVASFPWRELPDNLPQTANELGQGLASFRIESGPYNPRRAGGIWFMVCGPSMTVLGLLLLPAAMSQDQPGKVLSFACGSVPIGIMFFFLGLFIYFMSPPKLPYATSATLWLCEHGLIWSMAHKVHVWKWEDINFSRYIPQKASLSTIAHWDYDFRTKEGPPLVFGNANDAASTAIAEFIMCKIASAIWPRLRERLHEGKRISFGKLRFDLKEVEINNETALWSEVTGANYKLELFKVKGRGDHACLIEEINHPLLCMQLCQTLIAPDRPDESVRGPFEFS